MGRILTRLLAGVVVILVSSLPSAAQGAQDAQEDEGPYGPETGCEVDEKNDFRRGMISPGDRMRPDPAGGDVSTRVFYSLCPPEAYYLTYVDSRGVLGTLSEAVTKSGTGVLETAQKTGINSAASSVFVLHAKLVALTINVMNWAFEFDAVETFRGPVKALTSLLGERVYHVILPIVYVLVVGYAAWVSIGRGEVANGLVALGRSAVVGTLGTMIIAAPLATVSIYNDTINSTTRWVFGLVDEVAYSPEVIGDPDELGSPFEEPQSAPAPDKPGGAPPTDRGTDGQGPENNAANPMQGVSASIWRTYVHDPWSRMQISSDNAGADENGRNGVADEHAPDLLRIRHPDDRAKYLCDLAGADCAGWFGDGVGGDEPEETTGGETTGGDETTSGGDSTR